MDPAPRISRLWWFSAPVLAIMIGAVVVIGTLRVPYVILSPGGARSVGPLVTITQKPGGPKVTVDPATDDLLYLTVSSMVKPSGFLALRGWLDDKAEVEPSAPFLGTQTNQENRRLNLELMTDSQAKAKKVALERLGFEVKTVHQGAFLEDVDPTLPAGKVLKPGMTVVGADGKQIATRDQLVAAIGEHDPGDTMELQVVPLGETKPVTVKATLGERPDQPGEPVLGVSTVDRSTFVYPVDISIDSGQVGGPSAGLAFTLAILDRMTPGSLTGDGRVAVTGTIELDGSVGPVGGVNHKTEAAISEGAKLMLVPPDEYKEAVKASNGRIKVESVSTLDEALAALEAHGGDPLPAATR
ncbi:YlbL family protein [Aquihabitans sp. McL0605]|uniref:YlbL family protein n=1 Tax=Aquihabitans sp. McL0605 TaxID=3415671 RepID=UPI003CE67944